MSGEAASFESANPVSREVRLAAACCRWPPAEERDERIRALASEAVDWPLWLRVVKRQRVVGLARDALEHAGVEPPPAVDAVLGQVSRGIATKNLKVLGESVRLEALFRARAIPVVFLKGVALAQLAYGSISSKHGRDIDLLVPESAALEAWRLLEAEGYGLGAGLEGLGPAQRRAVVRYSPELEFIHRGDRLPLDLHWRPTQNPALLDTRGIWERTQPVAFEGGRQLPTLGETDLFAYLCAHGGMHAWARMKWLADVNALVSRRSLAEVEALYRAAQARGPGLCAGQALLLCRMLFDLPLPAGLERELRANRRIRRLARIALEVMIGRDGATEREDLKLSGLSRYLTYLSLLLLGDSWGYYGAQLKLLSIGPMDVVAWPLPERLHFLYPVARLPLWIGRQIRKGDVARRR